jgi:hypothetical protein
MSSFASRIIMLAIQRPRRRAALVSIVAAAVLFIPAAAIAAGGSHASRGSAQRVHVVGMAELPPLTSQAPTNARWAAKVQPAAGLEGAGECDLTIGGQKGAGICGTNPQEVIYSNGQAELLLIGVNRSIWDTWGSVNTNNQPVGTWHTWSNLGGYANDGVWLINSNQIEVRGRDDNLWCNTNSTTPPTPGNWAGWGQNCIFPFGL